MYHNFRKRTNINMMAGHEKSVAFKQGRCEELLLCVSQLNDKVDRRRVPIQDEDHPGNNPHLVPGFPRLCSGMFPERFRSASVSVGSEETRLM